MSVFGEWLSNRINGKPQGTPALPGIDPRPHVNNPEIQKPRFSNLRNTVENILIEDRVDTIDLNKGIRDFINRHGYQTKKVLGFDLEPEKLTDETMRNIVTGILAYYIPERKEFDKENLNRDFHLKPDRALQLILITLYLLSSDRTLFQQLINRNRNLEKLAVMFPDFFNTESAM